MANGGTSSISDTSKPRGNYLDPLKACALSGESNVPIGKSESATYAKFTSITRQMKRNASRASVLNDVERSRYDSLIKRIDGEKEYNISVLDRQFRQLQRSLTKLERQRRTVTGYSKEFASRDSFRNFMNWSCANKTKGTEEGGLNLPPIVEVTDHFQTEEELERQEKERLKKERELRLLADDLPELPGSKVRTLPAIDRPGFIAKGMPQLPNRFYGADEDPAS